MSTLRADLAERIAPVVLANITTRYPYHDAHLFQFGDEPVDPTSAHPAFGNSFDWHSSVHSHWTAMQLLAHFADAGYAPDVAEQLGDAVVRNLTAANVAAEIAYLDARPTYERPYGWAWAMLLGAAAVAPHREALLEIVTALRSLASHVTASAVRWLETMPGPVRHGVHSNTAFALGLMLDASRTLAYGELERAIVEHALAWFEEDRRYPSPWERSAHDFLSPGLAEADLMRRVLSRVHFRTWWRAFLPDARTESAITEVAQVPDVDDAQIVHLHGLNLSRAGMLARIAGALADDRDPEGVDADELAELLKRAEELFRAGVPHAYGSDYLSTHWLPTFAWDAASSIDAAR